MASRALEDRARSLVEDCETELLRSLPPGAEIFDAHTHLGTDIDGMRGHLDELIGVQERFGISGAFTFCLDEPDRHPGFRAANDRTLAYAERSGGRLLPFVRLDLEEDPTGEARRCLDRGARGIKLHPRAQGFALTDDRLAPIFAIAQERGVPILIHGGRGLPRIASGLARLVHAHPGAQLIIAHAGIADLAGLAGAFAGHPGVFFDTSVWSALDLLDFFRQISPEQVVYASDYPYGRQPNSLLLALRTARAAGFGEAELQGMLAGNARRIANGESPLPRSAPRGAATLTQHVTLARIHHYIAMASAALFMRQPDTFGALGLALNASEEIDGAQASHGRIRELLEAARDLWRALPELEDESERVRLGRTVSQLLHLADIVAMTEGCNPSR